MAAESISMNEPRVSYTRFLPIVLLSTLLATVLQIWHDVIYKPGPDFLQLWWLEAIIALIKYSALWICVALAFRQWKPAMIALGITLLLVAIDFFIADNDALRKGILFNDLYTVVFNVTFTPALVFGLLCFKKKALRYFLPLWLFAYAITLAYLGTAFLNISPYNAWYRLLHVDDLMRFRHNGGKTRIPLLFYSYSFIIPSTIFLLIGESYTAAAGTKKWKTLFRIDLANQYTSGGAISLFYTLRFFINMLVVGLLSIPIGRFYSLGHSGFRGQTIYSLYIMEAAGLVLLTAVVLYYRKFLIEYFISTQRKISWLFFFINIPIIGMFVFPFVALKKRICNTVEDRVDFFYHNAWYSDRPYGIMIVVLALSFIGAFATRGDSDMNWLVWFIELVLFIVYVLNITGYYLILGSGALGLIIFYAQAIIHALATDAETFNSKASFYYYFEELLFFWLIAAFGVIQYVVLLPVFHLNRIKTVQEPPVQPEEMSEVGIPIEI